MLYFKPLFCLLFCAVLCTYSLIRTYIQVCFLSLLRLLVAAAFIYLQTVQQRHLCSSTQCCIPHTLYLYDQSLLSQQFRSRAARLEGGNVTTTLRRLGSHNNVSSNETKDYRKMQQILTLISWSIRTLRRLILQISGKIVKKWQMFCWC